MRTSALLFVALLGLAQAATVFRNNAELRAELKAANGNGDVRSWQNPVAVAGKVTAYSFEAKFKNDNGQALASSTLTAVTSNSPSLLSPFSVDWAFVQSNGNGKGSGNGGGVQYTAEGTAVWTSFKIFGYVVYTDSNGNGVYDQGEETSVNSFKEGLFPYADVSVSNDTTKPTNWLITHTNGAVNATATMRYLISNQDVNSQGEYNKAENAKVDFWFQPSYSSNDASNARVALVTSYLAAQASVSAGGSIKGNGQHFKGRGDVSYTAGGITAQLQWAPTADVLDQNGVKSSVELQSQVLDLETTQGITFKAGTSFNGVVSNTQVTIGNKGNDQFKKAKLLLFSFQTDKPAELYWDPSVGQSNSAFTKAASIAVVVVCAILALF